MARTQSENYPEIRREFLRRAAAVFAAKGYPSATIANLAEASGMSRGLLYHYFASKEAVLKEMLSDHLDLMLSDVIASAERGADAQARLRNTIRAMVSINARSKDLQIVLLHDLHNLQAADRDAIVHKQREIVAVVRASVKAQDSARAIDESTLKAQTMMLIGMINYTYLWYDPDGPVGPEAYAGMVADTFLAGLRAALV